MVDARELSATEFQASALMVTPTPDGIWMTSFAYTAYTGILPAGPIALSLKEAVGPAAEGVLEPEEGTEASLEGLQALSKAHRGHRRLLVLDLTAANVDLSPLQKKGKEIAIITGVTLGLAYPFLRSWEERPVDLPVTGSAVLKVFDRNTRRIGETYPVNVAFTLEARGIAWAHDKEHVLLLEESSRSLGAWLGAEVIAVLSQ